MNEKLKHIELFAGCGGMSLGLDASGFELYFANELSPMAGETFSYNIMSEDLTGLSEKNMQAEKVLWIKSNFEKTNLKSRLRENPFTFEKGKYSDLNSTTDFNGKLLIGNIDLLLTFLDENKVVCQKLKEAKIDLISGGPPCQSFSLAGRREKDNKKNLLPLSFARFAGIVQPRIVLLENVKGITSPFTIEDEKYHAWVEVAKAFCLEGFVPLCMMVNSKYFGIPQNRPRFILLAIRRDVFKQLTKVVIDPTTLKILGSSNNFFKKVLLNSNSLNEVSKKDLELYDIEKMPELFNGKILPNIISKKDDFITANEAINDLADLDVNKYTLKHPSKYVTKLNALFKPKVSSIKFELKNHDPRNHGFNVKARFRWFQIVSKLNGLTPYALKILSGIYSDNEKMDLIFQKIKGEEILIKDINDEKEKFIKIDKYLTFTDYIKSIQTKKHSQRAIRENEPAPAQLTIPDDLCHYSESQLRTLTVREMARFQSFPDWFEFKSKVTTGGTSRSFEVPQYTQVGNAVPPKLAYDLGNLVKSILKQVENVK